jgi:lipopolysaccharide heptosyltransferase II
MIKISESRIPVRKKRIGALIIHYLLKVAFSFFRLFNLNPSNDNSDLLLDKIKKILVIRIDFLGDVTMSTPAFKAIRKIFPTSNITFLGASLSKELVEVMPIFDKIIYFDAPWLVKNKNNKLTRLLQTINKLRRERFDLAIDLRGDFRNNILMYISNIGCRLGFSITGCDFLLTDTVPCRSSHHVVNLCLDLIEYLNPKANEEHNLSLWVTKDDREFATNFFKYNYIDHNKNGDIVVIIHPGASWNGREWKVEKYAKVADRLIEKYKAKVILSGGPNDYRLVNDIENYMRHFVIKADKTSIRQFLALLEKSNLFIGSDSGPMHMATAMGIKVVALFGPALPEAVGPWGNGNIVLAHSSEFACSPCSQTVCKESKNSCMDAIQVNEVHEAAEIQMKIILSERDIEKRNKLENS